MSNVELFCIAADLQLNQGNVSDLQSAKLLIEWAGSCLHVAFERNWM